LWENDAEAGEFGAALLARYAGTHLRAGSHRKVDVLERGSWRVATWRRGADVWLVGSDDRRALEKAVHELTTTS
jgi:hypothetical protein